MMLSLRTLLRGFLLATLFLLAACAATQTSAQGAACCQAQTGQTDLRVELIAEGLTRPWGLAFLPDGSQLVTERGGTLRRVVNGNVSAPLGGVGAVAASDQGGLLDIALHPNFANNRLVYFSFSQAANGGRAGTAVARARLSSGANSFSNWQVIFSSNQPSSGGRHFGSRLAFAPDGTLFITSGERGTPSRSQDPFDHAGKVLRLNADGSIPRDNPFADGVEALPEIWSLGHRNPQGAAIHPSTGALWISEHGAAGGDEINAPSPGLNYGWPRISYGRNYNGTGFELGQSAPGLEQPLYYWDPSIAPSGLAFYDPAGEAAIPAWRGSLLVGALKAQQLSRLSLNGTDIVAEEIYLGNQVGRIRDVRTGPDGAVWLLTDSDQGRIYRLSQP